MGDLGGWRNAWELPKIYMEPGDPVVKRVECLGKNMEPGDPWSTYEQPSRNSNQKKTAYCGSLSLFSSASRMTALTSN